MSSRLLLLKDVHGSITVERKLGLRKASCAILTPPGGADIA